MGDIPQRLTSSLADRYGILRELGTGGMATVYLAEDVRHQRQVAIKVLHPELALAVGAERFLREITTTANLRHPQILPLFDSGEAGGFLYYVMPFVAGESLRDRIARDSPLPVEEACRIALEVADALAYAHDRGVVHRDIKPDNILVEDGRAVVADFGIASALADTGSDRITRTGASLGTPIYMSPEQASGEVTDGRSDLYSLACVLYEMLAGEPPFTGPSAIAILARHMTDPVPSLTAIRPSAPEPLSRLLERSLAKEPADRFPSMTAWRAAVRDALSGTPAPGAGVRVEPPVPPTDLIGREAQLDAVIRQLRAGVRVLTVTGVGGTGKTRFAIELFRRIEDEFTGGAAFVSLASVTSHDEVLPTLSTTLDIAEAHGRSALDALVTVLGDQNVLLVLDNFEQVVEAASDLADLVARCPGIQVVVTSRRPLKIGAEAEFVLPPLDLPDTGATDLARLMACPSVTLFVERARKVKPGFELTPDNAAAVSGICRSLDGLPLALELAAARIRVLEPESLLQRLDHALDLLTSGDRDLPLRQRTLRATISWSYSLLSAEEQRLLRRLSSFHEGWTFDALEQVCYDEEDRWRALDELDSLVEKGLVRVVGDGERFSLLETIRAFAAEQLHAGAEVEAARDAHARYFLAFAREVDRGIQGGAQLEMMARARAENANTFAALGWLLARARTGDADAIEQGMRMCGWLGWYWHIVGLHLVAEESVDALLSLAEAAGLGPSPGRGLARFTAGMVAANTGEMQRAYDVWAAMAEDGEAIGDDAIHSFGLGGMGYAALGMGRPEIAGEPLDRSIRLAERAQSEYLTALMKAIKGMWLFMEGDIDGGIAVIEEARRLQVPAGDFEGGGLALSFLASMTFAKGDLDRALDLYREAEESFATVGDKPEVARVQCEMGYAELAGGNVDRARWTFRRAVRTYDEVGSPRGTGQALLGLAAAEAASGNAERALAVATAAEAMSERAGVVVEHPLAPGVAEQIEALKAGVPLEKLDAVRAGGAAMTPAEVLAMVAA